MFASIDTEIYRVFVLIRVKFILLIEFVFLCGNYCVLWVMIVE